VQLFGFASFFSVFFRIFEILSGMACLAGEINVGLRSMNIRISSRPASGRLPEEGHFGIRIMPIG